MPENAEPWRSSSPITGACCCSCAMRRPAVPPAGAWGMFGGHLEAGERPAAALLRELQEELGWRPTTSSPTRSARSRAATLRGRV